MVVFFHSHTLNSMVYLPTFGSLFMGNVGKYSINGAYGAPLTIYDLNKLNPRWRIRGTGIFVPTLSLGNLI